MPLVVLCKIIATLSVLLTPLMLSLSEDTVTLDSIVSPPVHQRTLSSSLDLQCFRSLLNASSLANKAHLLSASAPHASSWFTVVPTVELGVHLDPSEFSIAMRWWLSVDTSGGLPCSFCSDIALDPLGHHAATCRRGGDVVLRHTTCEMPLLSFAIKPI